MTVSSLPARPSKQQAAAAATRKEMNAVRPCFPQQTTTRAPTHTVWILQHRKARALQTTPDSRRLPFCLEKRGKIRRLCYYQFVFVFCYYCWEKDVCGLRQFTQVCAFVWSLTKWSLEFRTQKAWLAHNYELLTHEPMTRGWEGEKSGSSRPQPYRLIYLGRLSQDSPVLGFSVVAADNFTDSVGSFWTLLVRQWQHATSGRVALYPSVSPPATGTDRSGGRGSREV